MPKLALNGFSMYYQSFGSGEPIVFLPGALGTGATDFEPQLAWFSQFYQVIAPDLRGYGESRPPERDYPPGFYQRDAEDVLALMTALGHDAFSVFGWSDGANAAALMAAHAPQRVRRMVVWGGNSYISAEEIAIFRDIRSLSSWSPREVASMRITYGDSLDDLWERYVVGLEEHYEAGGDLYGSQLSRIHCPTMILHGEKDPLVPPFHPRILAQGIAGSVLHIFPEGKHKIHAKYAAEFNERTFAFLQKP